MSDTNRQHENANQKLPVPKKFPDLETCQVKPTGIQDFLECASTWASYCPYSVSFGRSHYCRYPLRGEFFKTVEP